MCSYLLVGCCFFFTAAKLLSQHLYLLLKASTLYFVWVPGFIHLDL